MWLTFQLLLFLHPGYSFIGESLPVWVFCAYMTKHYKPFFFMYKIMAGECLSKLSTLDAQIIDIAQVNLAWLFLLISNVIIDTFFWGYDQQIKSFDMVIDCFSPDFIFYLLHKLYSKLADIIVLFHFCSNIYLIHVPTNSNNVQNGFWSQNLSIFYFELHIFCNKGRVFSFLKN